MQLWALDLHELPVNDLSPLLGMPLRELYLENPAWPMKGLEPAEQQVKELAERRVRSSPEVGFIWSMLFSVIVQLIVELILMWIDNRTRDPGPKFKAGEPGYDG